MRSAAIILYIMTTNGPVSLKPLQKKRKYGPVISMTRRARLSSAPEEQERRKGTARMLRAQAIRNMTREGHRNRVRKKRRKPRWVVSFAAQNR